MLSHQLKTTSETHFPEENNVKKLCISAVNRKEENVEEKIAKMLRLLKALYRILFPMQFKNFKNTKKKLQKFLFHFLCTTHRMNIEKNCRNN